LGKGEKVKKIAVILVAATLAACSSTTVINSEPSGATLYLNDEKVGATPYTHTDTKIVGSTTKVTLKKQGYQDLTTAFRRNEETNVGAIISGIFVLVPFLWVMEYKPSHFYEMLPLKDAANK
jgi:hypothetical protein